MQEYISQYLEWKGTYAPRAAINYRKWLERFFDIHKIELIERITIRDVVGFQKYVESYFSPTTTAFAMVVIKNFFKFYRLQGIGCLSPELIKIPKVKAKSFQPITYDEYQQLCSLFREDEFYNLRNLLLIRFLWETGMRVGELCDMNVSDLDTKKLSSVIRTKKSNQIRMIFWSEHTHSLLLKYVGVRICLNNSPALWVGLIGEESTDRLSIRQIQKIIKKASREANILKKVSPHSFRHAKAHYILEKGGTVKDIQMILGHSERNPAASFTYLQLNNQELEQRARKFL